jgi:hypothetical protein
VKDGDFHTGFPGKVTHENLMGQQWRSVSAFLLLYHLGHGAGLMARASF